MPGLDTQLPVKETEDATTPAGALEIISSTTMRQAVDKVDQTSVVLSETTTQTIDDHAASCFPGLKPFLVQFDLTPGPYREQRYDIRILMILLDHTKPGPVACWGWTIKGC